MDDPLIITIDGPAGSGKSTLAMGLARSFGIGFLNTGAIYRALGYKAILSKIDPTDEIQAFEILNHTDIDFYATDSSDGKCDVVLDGTIITDKLWTNEVSQAASAISEHPKVREAMVELQRKIAKSLIDKCRKGAKFRGVVVEGRDAGTVIFPGAKVKFFLVASIEERANRRINDFKENSKSLQEIEAELLKRDLRDETRAASPLIPAQDSIVLDNSDWKKEDTLRNALALIKLKLGIEPITSE